jgi:23S rRNA (adenine2030-N6)-methyltransferase
VLSYRHLFHAGNFADVFKHTLLTRLLLLLGRKDKPYLYLDTHAGTGRYDLSHPWAQRSGEYHDGIERLWQCQDVPALLVPYLESVRADNPSGRLRYYPGSPRLAHRMLRAGDRMVLNELNPDDCEKLSALFRAERRVVVQRQDGYQALRANLPPRERRGLILIDSSFDRAQEFARLAQALASAHRRFATGVYALWYPLMAPAAMHAFGRAIVATGVPKILQLELSLHPENWSLTLRGCGMLVVNPPFGFVEEARSVLEFLSPILADGEPGRFRVQWLSPE